jgi:hypothetical protein
VPSQLHIPSSKGRGLEWCPAMPFRAELQRITSPCGEVALWFPLDQYGPCGRCWDALAQSADSSPRPCPGNVAPWLPRCGQKISGAWAQRHNQSHWMRRVTLHRPGTPSPNMPVGKHLSALQAQWVKWRPWCSPRSFEFRKMRKQHRVAKRLPRIGILGTVCGD